MATELAEKPNRHERMQYLKSKVLYARGSSDKNDAGKSYKMVLIKGSQIQAFYVWNQCRKETDPTYNDSGIE